MSEENLTTEETEEFLRLLHDAFGADRSAAHQQWAMELGLALARTFKAEGKEPLSPREMAIVCALGSAFQRELTIVSVRQSLRLSGARVGHDAYLQIPTNRDLLEGLRRLEIARNIGKDTQS